MTSEERVSYYIRVMQELAEAGTCRVNIGCIIVKNKEMVGIGYNGSVHGDSHCEDVGCLMVQAPHQGSSASGFSCIRTVHAELNAVLKCKERGSEGDWMESFSTYSPCINCLKALLQIGVRTCYFLKPYKDDWRDTYLAQLNPVFMNVRMIKWSLEAGEAFEKR